MILSAIFLVILYFLLNFSFSICSLNTDFLKGFFWPTTGLFVFFFFFPTPILLKCNWHITFYKFKIYNIVVVLDSVVSNSLQPHGM